MGQRSCVAQAYHTLRILEKKQAHRVFFKASGELWFEVLTIVDSKFVPVFNIALPNESTKSNEQICTNSYSRQ